MVTILLNAATDSVSGPFSKMARMNDEKVPSSLPAARLASAVMRRRASRPLPLAAARRAAFSSSDLVCYIESTCPV